MIPEPYEGPRFFFLHVMKTAGGTFANYLRSNFPVGSVYPAKGVEADLEAATYDIPTLLGLPPERHRSIAVYTGHFPSIAADLLEGELARPLVRLTILREPVARAVSYLRHCQEHHPHHRDLSLEAIYDEDFTNAGFIRNHQVKQFAFRLEDDVRAYFQRLEIDDERWQEACRNLDRVDVIGLAESFPMLLEHVRARFGWGPLKRDRVHESLGGAVASPGLLRRIAEDNAADLAFYDRARDLARGRGG